MARVPLPRMKTIIVLCALLCLAPPLAAAENATYAPDPGDDPDGPLPCVVVDWNYLTVGVIYNCWGPL